MALEKRTWSFAWVGKGEMLNGSYQYKSMLINDVSIGVGDSVTVNSSHSHDSIGLIRELYECIFSGDKNIRLQWYMLQAEVQQKYQIPLEEKVTFTDKELVLTDMYNLVSVESIYGKVTVGNGCESDGIRTTRNKEQHTCNWLLDTARRKLRPISEVLSVVSDTKDSPSSSRTRKSKLAAFGKITNAFKRDACSNQSPCTPEVSPKSGNIVSLKTLSKVRKSFRKLHDGVFVSSDEGSITEREESSSPPAKRRKMSHQTLKTLSSRRTVSRRNGKKEIATSIPTRISKVVSAKGQLGQYESLKERLHVSSIPNSLPCREDQFTNILSFIENKLIHKESGCMYVSGVPGTGKTATVHEVSRNLQDAAAAGEIPSFKFIEINGLHVTEPRQAYVSILKQLTGEKTTADKAAAILNEYFCSSVKRRKKNQQRQRESILLLADELDLLWTRKQSVLYNLFDWPSHPNSRLIVIAVANTMDLPERLMMNKVSSRLGLTRLTFHPYNFNQLKDIITTRLKDIKIFDQDATEMAARKVASVSGDARRALDICRRAVEIAQRANENELSSSKGRSRKVTLCVGMAHVTAAVSEMFSSPMVTAIRRCSLYQNFFLQALVAELIRTDQEVTTLKPVFCQLTEICRMEGHSPISVTQATAICTILSTMRIILVESGRGDLNRQVRLGVTQDDVFYALKEL